jgi:hypothetical protein
MRAEMNRAASPLPKLFFTLKEFQAAGGPGRVKCYDLHKHAKLNLVKDAAGRVGITAEEACRYFASAQPLDEVKRDTSKATWARKEQAGASRRTA